MQLSGDAVAAQLCSCRERAECLEQHAGELLRDAGLLSIISLFALLNTCSVWPQVSKKSSVLGDYSSQHQKG